MHWRFRSCSRALHTPNTHVASVCACRYLNLLRQGAENWQLDKRYRSWLNNLHSIDARERGDAYYQDLAGQPLKGWPKTRVGSDEEQ